MTELWVERTGTRRYTGRSSRGAEVAIEVVGVGGVGGEGEGVGAGRHRVGVGEDPQRLDGDQIVGAKLPAGGALAQLGDLPGGLYFISAVSGQKLYSGRFVKK